MLVPRLNFTYMQGIGIDTKKCSYGFFERIFLYWHSFESFRLLQIDTFFKQGAGGLGCHHGVIIGGGHQPMGTGKNSYKRGGAWSVEYSPDYMSKQDDHLLYFHLMLQIAESHATHGSRSKHLTL